MSETDVSSDKDTDIKPPPPLLETCDPLEHILLCLNDKILRTARLVNYFWHILIQQPPTLCATWRQRLRLRLLRINLLGTTNVEQRSLVRRWCWLSPKEAIVPRYRGYDSSVVKLPETDGEIWTAEFGHCDWESGMRT